MIRFVVPFLFVLAYCNQAAAQSTVYAPLGQYQPLQSHWESTLVRHEAAASPKANARPVLPGLRPVPVELLQDAFLRKHPKLLRNDPVMARRLIGRRYLAGVNGRNYIHGAMAEALFIKKNPEWAYVSKPNAPQHDVYRSMPGKRPPMNAQVKFHSSGKASIYARDMVKDFRAHRFLVPDDHVQSIREHWLRRYERAKQAGDVIGAKQAARNAWRVHPMGATKHEIVSTSKQAAEYSTAEVRSAYISLAAGVSLSLGQIGLDYLQGTLSADQAAYRTTKAFSLIGTGVVADASLPFIGGGALRGSLRGNLIVSTVVFLVDTSWSVYDHGGLAAFQHPDFYEQLGGSVSAVSLGGIAAFYSGAAATSIASELGPGAPLVGGIIGIVVGTGVGIVAYVGGKSATSWLVKSLWPELYQQFEQQQIAAAKEGIARQIALSQTLQ